MEFPRNGKIITAVPVTSAMRLRFVLFLLACPLAANPVMDGADPHVTAVGKDFWLYPTEARSRRPVFAAYRSTGARLEPGTTIVVYDLA